MPRRAFLVTLFCEFLPSLRQALPVSHSAYLAKFKSKSITQEKKSSLAWLDQALRNSSNRDFIFHFVICINMFSWWKIALTFLPKCMFYKAQNIWISLASHHHMTIAPTVFAAWTKSKFKEVSIHCKCRPSYKTSILDNLFYIKTLKVQVWEGDLWGGWGIQEWKRDEWV